MKNFIFVLLLFSVWMDEEGCSFFVCNDELIQLKISAKIKSSRQSEREVNGYRRFQCVCIDLSFALFFIIIKCYAVLFVLSRWRGGRRIYFLQHSTDTWDDEEIREGINKKRTEYLSFHAVISTWQRERIWNFQLKALHISRR